MDKKRIIVGISGASGIPVAIEVLNMLKMLQQYEVHLVLTDGARATLYHESNRTENEIYAYADYVYDNRDIGAAIASGSFRTEGMIVVPCSMKTVAGIAAGYSDSLLLRAADVMLKERKRLVLLVREAPINRIHLRNMQEVCEAGADIIPLVMTFYNQPKNIEDMVHHIACKGLERFGIEPFNYKRWMDEGGAE